MYHKTDAGFVVLEEVYLNPNIQGATAPSRSKQQRPHRAYLFNELLNCCRINGNLQKLLISLKRVPSLV